MNRIQYASRLCLVPALLALAACSGSTVTVGEQAGSDGGDTTADGGGAGVEGGSGSADGGSPEGATADGNTAGTMLSIHIKGSTTPVAQTGSWPGETPIDQKLGIRSLTLLKSASDPTPYMVFDHGANSVEAGYNDGDDTEVGSVPKSQLVPGTYTFARVEVSHSRYTIDATVHSYGVPYAGQLEAIYVVSDGAVVDGHTWNKGHYEVTFDFNGTTVGPQVGENAPLPLQSSVGGITFDTSGSVAAYVFPINIVIPDHPDDGTPVEIDFNANTYKDFRWEDQTAYGYTDSVFDVTPGVSMEPVVVFSANSFTVTGSW